MDRNLFLERIKETRGAWDLLVGGLSAEQLVDSSLDGLSVKDIMAHITWHEKEMVGVLQARALVGSTLWNLPTDERNLEIYKLIRNRELADIQSEAGQVFSLLMSLLENLTQDELDDPARFNEMPLEWLPWEMIASNTYEHYEDHIDQVNAWLDKQAE